MMARRTLHHPRPALVSDVMTVLQRRRDHHTPIRQWVMEGRLPKGLYGFRDALYGAVERDLLTLDERLPGRAGRAVKLTPTGINWTPREDGQPVPLVYTWWQDGKPVLGTLTDWAHAWAVLEEKVPGGPLGWSLAGERFNSYMPYIHPVPEGWRVVAAGEQVILPANDKEAPCPTTA